MNDYAKEIAADPRGHRRRRRFDRGYAGPGAAQDSNPCAPKSKSSNPCAPKAKNAANPCAAKGNPLRGEEVT
jgi:hypothetical protein